MASTFVNDLRLNEMSTGDQSGSWGTVTNLNLELIGEAFSYGTEAITTNADTHTTTIADGAADPGRSMFLKYTGTLDSACTITIGPNTVSKMWFIENATTGSQNIIISQGSGANVTIAAGQTKAVYSNGTGTGAAFVDAFDSLSVGALASAGAVSGTTGTFSGAVSGTTGAFSSAVSGTTGTFSGAVSGTTGTFSSAVSGTTGTFTGNVDFSAGIDVTGNITVTGTVDGRDVAADGTKLDGIEAGANVTDTTNVVAALTAGSNVTISGAGVIASSFTNTTYSAGAGLDLTGTTFSIESDLRGEAWVIGRDTNDYFSVDTTQFDWVLDGATDMRLYNNGDLHVEGNVIAYSTTISDERLKTDIVKIDGALDKVDQLNGYTFTYIADGKKSAGVIAQEVQKVLPSAIIESKLPLKMGDDDETEYMTVQYDQLMGLMVEAIKELKAEVAELKGK